MVDQEITLTVLRYSPEKGPEPYKQSYKVPTHERMMVLDALNYIRDEIDPTLAFRWSCRMGVCGSCGMNVNGAPKLTCEDPVERYRGEEISIEALDNFPIVRDLIADISSFMEKLRSVKPWVIRKDEIPLSEGEHHQTPEQRKIYATQSGCINCLLCYSACPVFGLDSNFVGPAALALAYRYNMDSRDQGEEERRPVLSQSDAVWDCTFVGECSQACPKGVLPAEVIQRSKVRLAQQWVGSTLMPWSKR